MRKSLVRKPAAIAAAVTASIGIGMAPAMAVPINVAVGAYGTPQDFIGTASAGVTLAAGVPVYCTNIVAYGKLNPGAVSTPATIGTIPKLRAGGGAGTVWNNCTSPLPGLPSVATVTQSSDWNVVATGAPVGGVTPVQLTNVGLTVSIGGICTLSVTGVAGGNFNNGTQALTLTGTSTLSVARTGLCPGYSATGSLSTAYGVTEAATGGIFPVTIS